MILLILGSAYWGGVLIREAIFVLQILLYGGALLLENGGGGALIRSFTVVQNDKSVCNII